MERDDHRPALSVLISYSHYDAWAKDRLRVHLTPIERQAAIELWSDEEIELGKDWQLEIKAALARADVAILLVSADFFASDFIARIELPSLLEAASKRGVLILPVVVAPCRFGREHWLARFQAANDRPLSSMDPHEQEEVFDRIALTIEEYLGTRTATSLAACTMGEV